jgi:hypothetical protein
VGEEPDGFAAQVAHCLVVRDVLLVRHGPSSKGYSK